MTFILKAVLAGLELLCFVAEAVARNDLGLFKLLLQVRSDNAQAIKLYERADWRLVGHLEAHYHDGEERHDAAIYEKVLAA